MKPATQETRLKHMSDGSIIVDDQCLGKGIRRKKQPKLVEFDQLNKIEPGWYIVRIIRWGKPTFEVLYCDGYIWTFFANSYVSWQEEVTHYYPESYKP